MNQANVRELAARRGEERTLILKVEDEEMIVVIGMNQIVDVEMIV
jgi:hypothetical protein